MSAAPDHQLLTDLSGLPDVVVHVVVGGALVGELGQADALRREVLVQVELVQRRRGDLITRMTERASRVSSLVSVMMMMMMMMMMSVIMTTLITTSVNNPNTNTNTTTTTLPHDLTSLSAGGNTAGCRGGSGQSNSGGMSESGSCFTCTDSYSATASGISDVSNRKRLSLNSLRGGGISEGVGVEGGSSPVLPWSRCLRRAV
jgi:hypothetical protein